MGNQNITPGAPVFLQLQGNPQFKAENLVAYEIGYREAPPDRFYWDIAAYCNSYDRLKVYQAGTPFATPTGFFFPLLTTNDGAATSFRSELTSTYQINPCWRLYSGYSVFELHSATIPNSSPNNQLYVRSSWDLGQDVQFDVIGRYVDQLPGSPISGSVPRYIEMDMRIGWQVRKNLEVSFVGQNLLHDHHLEFIDPGFGQVSTQVRRGWYGMLSWKF